MKIENIHIHGIGGIEDLEISFNPHMNIICGPNGIGKTTILECIAQTFTYHSNTLLRKKSDHDSGFWTINTAGQTFTIKRSNFHPNDRLRPDGYFGTDFAKNIVNIKTQRWFDYIPLQAVSSDPRMMDDDNMLVNGMQLMDAKNWFVHRHLWSVHNDALSEAQKHNFEIAKTVFSRIDPSTTFSKVKAASYDIMLEQHDGTEIYFEYLSSGYKSIVFILLGLIKEIEHRFSNDNLMVEDFEGVVLIDELDLHLHPQWQANILTVLSELFPKAQFITSTHSAHIIQSAETDQIIPLGRNENGQIYKRDIPSGQYGFKGWTVEEILTDVMGLQETRSPLFVQKIHDFEVALAEENYINAVDAYKVLEKMLHPNNHLKKLLKLQLISLGRDVDD